MFSIIKWLIRLINIGNFGFGIDEHIDLGIKYDTNTGIFGMDFYVILGRAGKRVARRKHAKGKFGKHQRITADEAKQWFTEKMAGTIIWWGVLTLPQLRFLDQILWKASWLIQNTQTINNAIYNN